MLNKYIDHTLLKADTTIENIEKLCGEAIEHSFFSVCVNPSFVKIAKKLLEDSTVKVCTVVGFPLGSSTTESKIFEAKDAVLNGADEIDMVINVGRLKENHINYIKYEINAIKEVCGDKILKVILETCLLDNQEIINACEACIESKADFVKTSTGFAKEGATLDIVKLIKHTVGDRILIKASGGIKSYECALNFLEIGVSRIGTSSSVEIVNKELSKSDY